MMTMTTTRWMLLGGVMLVIIVAVLLSLLAHEQPVHHIEKPLKNVTFSG